MSLGPLIALSVGLGLVGLGAFFWALRHGQFDDPDGAAWRVLLPDPDPPSKGPDDDHLASHAENRDPRGGV
jgi:cbb3-type cytochrome oxidase maturation protein